MSVRLYWPALSVFGLPKLVAADKFERLRLGRDIGLDESLVVLRCRLSSSLLLIAEVVLNISVHISFRSPSFWLWSRFGQYFNAHSSCALFIFSLWILSCEFHANDGIWSKNNLTRTMHKCWIGFLFKMIIYNATSWHLRLFSRTRSLNKQRNKLVAFFKPDTNKSNIICTLVSIYSLICSKYAQRNYNMPNEHIIYILYVWISNMRTASACFHFAHVMWQN